MSSVGTSIETNITSVEYPNLYVDALVDLDTNAVLAGKKGSRYSPKYIDRRRLGTFPFN